MNDRPAGRRTIHKDQRQEKTIKYVQAIPIRLPVPGPAQPTATGQLRLQQPVHIWSQAVAMFGSWFGRWSSLFGYQMAVVGVSVLLLLSSVVIVSSCRRVVIVVVVVSSSSSSSSLSSSEHRSEVESRRNYTVCSTVTPRLTGEMEVATFCSERGSVSIQHWRPPRQVCVETAGNLYLYVEHRQTRIRHSSELRFCRSTSLIGSP